MNRAAVRVRAAGEVVAESVHFEDAVPAEPTFEQQINARDGTVEARGNFAAKSAGTIALISL